MCSHGPVLIVEDDPDFRAALADTFASVCGRPATVARDGAEALQVVSAGAAPCVILTDIEMPRMGGLELIDALAAAGYGHIPIVTMSGNRRSPGAPHVDLQKPFEGREAFAAVRESVGDRCAIVPGIGRERGT